MKHYRPSNDDGFTLVELLISIALIGVLMPVIAGTFSVVLRTTPGVGERTDNAHTLQGVVTWLPQDIDSTPPGGFDISAGAASGCTVSPGTNLLRLEWTENVGSGLVRYVANYRHVLVGSSYFIQRVTCNGIGAGPLGNAIARSVSSALPNIPPGWAPGQMPFRVIVDTTGGDVLVSFEVQTLTGKTVRTDSAPKNPANTLVPPSTEPVPTVATTTTTTTTTTLPAATTTTTTNPAASTTSTSSTTSTTSTTTTTTLPPCVIASKTLSPTSVKNTDPNGNGNSATNVGVLASAVTLTVTTTGVCTGLEARAQTGAPNGELFHNFTGSGPTFTVTFPGYPQGSSELWADGNRTIAVYTAAGGPYATVVLVVK